MRELADSASTFPFLLASASSAAIESLTQTLPAEEAQDVHPDVDDTDGLDPEGEFEAWKLRELQRLKRDREERYACVPLSVLPSSPCARPVAPGPD